MYNWESVSYQRKNIKHNLILEKSMKFIEILDMGQQQEKYM